MTISGDILEKSGAGDKAKAHRKPSKIGSHNKAKTRKKASSQSSTRSRLWLASADVIRVAEHQKPGGFGFENICMIKKHKSGTVH